MAKKKPEIQNALFESYLRAQLHPPRFADYVIKLIAQRGVKPWETDRLIARGIAENIWAKYPELPIESKSQPNVVYMVMHRIKEEFGKEYSRRTVRGWIKDLCPNRRPGRRRDIVPS